MKVSFGLLGDFRVLLDAGGRESLASQVLPPFGSAQKNSSFQGSFFWDAKLGCFRYAADGIAVFLPVCYYRIDNSLIVI